MNTQALQSVMDFLLKFPTLLFLVRGLKDSGLTLHALKGKQQGRWSVMVSANWRITFYFQGGGAHDINLEDYH